MKNIKKILSLVLVLCLAAGMVACGGLNGNLVQPLRHGEVMDSEALESPVMVRVSYDNWEYTSVKMDVNAAGYVVTWLNDDYMHIGKKGTYDKEYGGYETDITVSLDSIEYNYYDDYDEDIEDNISYYTDEHDFIAVYELEDGDSVITFSYYDYDMDEKIMKSIKKDIKKLLENITVKYDVDEDSSTADKMDGLKFSNGWCVDDVIDVSWGSEKAEFTVPDEDGYSGTWVDIRFETKEYVDSLYEGASADVEEVKNSKGKKIGFADTLYDDSSSRQYYINYDSKYYASIYICNYDGELDVYEWSEIEDLLNSGNK